jgi:cell filamentation protein
MINDKGSRKQRILVMNGQRVVQQEQEGQWVTQKVGKARHLKPGIYNAYLAQDADRNRRHTGFTFHADESYVYQHEGALGLTRHPLSAFGAVPEYGLPVTISYEEGRAVTVAATQGLGQKHSR